MKLKVALFNESFPPFIDGVAMAVKNYAQVIHDKFGESFVVTPRLKGIYDDYPFKVIRYHSVRTNEKIQYPAGNPLSIPAIRTIRKEKPDIIHVHSPFSCSVLARMCSLDNNIPVVLTYHTKFDQDIDYKIGPKAFKKIAIEFVLKNVQSADEVWVVTKGCGNSLRNIGYKGAFRVMENGTDFPRGEARPDQISRLNEEFGLNPNENILLFVGRMMWYKNIKLILDAAHKSHLAGTDFKMIFVGDGLDIDEIKQYVRRRGMNSYVIFTGAIRDREVLRVLYSRADLFMFPSTYDTSGLVVKEAAACNTASLVVRGSCAAEGIEDCFSGFLCDENAASCSSAIDNALSNRTRLSEIGKNSGRYIYLSWEDAVSKAYGRYEEIVKLWNTLPQVGRRRMFKKMSERR